MFQECSSCCKISDLPNLLSFFCRLWPIQLVFLALLLCCRSAGLWNAPKRRTPKPKKPQSLFQRLQGLLQSMAIRSKPKERFRRGNGNLFWGGWNEQHVYRDFAAKSSGWQAYWQHCQLQRILGTTDFFSVFPFVSKKISSFLRILVLLLRLSSFFKSAASALLQRAGSQVATGDSEWSLPESPKPRCEKGAAVCRPETVEPFRILFLRVFLKKNVFSWKHFRNISAQIGRYQ